MENSCKHVTFTDIIRALTTLNISSACFIPIIIKFLGIFLFVLSISSKIPQILSMIRKKTNKGLSIVSLYSDFVNVLLQGIFSYNKNLPMYIYGEYFSISLQNGFLILLFWYYEEKDKAKPDNKLKIIRALSTLSILIFVYICLVKSEIIPNEVFQILGLSNLPITTTSRVSQIIVLIYSKDVGCLSFSSNLMKFLKNCIKATIILLDVYNPILFFNQVYNGFTVFVILVIIVVLNRKKQNMKEKNE